MSIKSLILPEVSLGPYSISRLIAGGNPSQGGSHQTRLMNIHMSEYFTLDQTVEFLRHCRKQGINTWQTTYSQKICNALMRFREEDVQMQWICLCSPEQVADKKEFAKVLELNPLGVAFHGEITDKIWRAGKIDTAIDTLRRYATLAFLLVYLRTIRKLSNTLKKMTGILISIWHVYTEKVGTALNSWKLCARCR